MNDKLTGKAASQTNALPGYAYASGDLLEERNTYFYSVFQGAGFLDAWRAQRDAALSAPCLNHDDVSPDTSPTAALLEALWTTLQAGPDPQACATLAHLLQRFEVSKRVHGAYGPNWRPLDPADYLRLDRYLRLAELLDLAWSRDTALPWLNGLLKLLDTLTALQGRLSAPQQQRLRRLIANEGAHVTALQRQLEGAARAA
ncbi:MAG: hypothetical protein QM776_02485 [Rhodocyclaceae bacterium]